MTLDGAKVYEAIRDCPRCAARLAPLLLGAQLRSVNTSSRRARAAAAKSLARILTGASNGSR